MSETPHYVQPVVGYRAFVVRDDGLWSIIARGAGEWVPRAETTAVCRRDDACFELFRQTDGPLPKHAAPHEDCHCGLYSYFEPAAAAYQAEVASRSGYPSTPWKGAQHTLVGAVVSWGDLLTHQTGVRAQHSTLVALLDDGSLEAVMIAERYGVALCRGKQALVDLAEAHGERRPQAALPTEQDLNAWRAERSARATRAASKNASAAANARLSAKGPGFGQNIHVRGGVFTRPSSGFVPGEGGNGVYGHIARDSRGKFAFHSLMAGAGTAAAPIFRPLVAPAARLEMPTWLAVRIGHVQHMRERGRRIRAKRRAQASVRVEIPFGHVSIGGGRIASTNRWRWTSSIVAIGWGVFAGAAGVGTVGVLFVTIAVHAALEISRPGR